MSNNSVRSRSEHGYIWRQAWFPHGLHRIDGPAIEWDSGDKEWYINGERHREDGPAIEWADGDKSWWFEGRRHREDGPAIDWVSGRKEWWLNGVRLNPVEHLIRVQGITHSE